MNDHTAEPLLKHKAKAAFVRTLAQSFGIALRAGAVSCLPTSVPANDLIYLHNGSNRT